MQISKHRKFLNEVLLHKWKFSKDSLVYDIGVNGTWDYGFTTIDRDPDKHPDILLDMEKGSPITKADGILFNGVFEQCGNPWVLMDKMTLCLKDKGILIAGLAGIGMPFYGENDKWRVTKQGAIDYMKYFNILDFHEFPEYFYVVGSLRN